MGLHRWKLLLPLVFFFTVQNSKALDTSIHGDALSLLRFKDSVSSDPSNLLAGWSNNPTSNHCEWNGVTCDGRLSGRVIALNLTGLLGGKLTPSIGDMSELRILSIPQNRFSGEIPVSLVKLQLLEVLELQGNNFSGMIPNQISYLHYLRLLNLSNNAFSGSIPSNLIGSGNLSVVDLSNNMLSGPVIVDGLSGCDSLNHLRLSNNFLTGRIPSQIGKCRNLRILLLDGNILEGRIPPEIGNIVELRVLDFSRNSLTERIPKELANCHKLSVIVLTNLFDDQTPPDVNLVNSFRGEFNAFVGNVPPQVLLLSSLQILWAPRANLGGRLPSGWSDSCSLRVLNLAENYITGVIPETLGICRNLTFLDLSSNNLVGYFPSKQLQVPCMAYFNVSRNNISGILPGFVKESCDIASTLALQDPKFLDIENFGKIYFNLPVWTSEKNALIGSGLEEAIVISHDFSWNSFMGSLPSFLLGDNLFARNIEVSYMLSLNNNEFNGTLPYGLVSNCKDLKMLSVNLSVNQLSGGNSQGLLLDCLQLTEFEAAYNQIGGSIGPVIGNWVKLQRLDLRGNKISGSLPDQLGNLKNMKWMLLGGNNLTGEIPPQLGQLTSLSELDLSHNALTGIIPASLTNARSLETLLLDHNKLSGEIPSSFSTLPTLTRLDVSFNNLSGHIPHLQHTSDCNSFRGNEHLHSCPDLYSAPPAPLPVPLEVQNWHRHKRLKIIIIAVAASVALCILLGLIFLIKLRRSKFGQLRSLRRRQVVTFQDVPTDLSYDKVVTATGNFSIGNLIGTGGFGSTYKAELSPGFLVAIKRLSIGRFQGIQQFETEIRTLGRIRHKNLVTLIGYYVGEAEMFLIYNYLSGGNLEAFIHDRSSKNSQWSVVYKIAKDIADAIAYLHYSCVPRIVHRDIKPSNILLDEDLNAYLSDFGLARLLEVSETHATTEVAGTFGYVAPEYATTCRVSDKADVYSFGVVLLELMSGRKSLDPSFSEYGNGFNIVPWAKLLLAEGRPSELFSPALWEAGPKDNLLGLLRIALTCTVETLSVRPSMKQVVEKLKRLKS